MDIRWPLMNLKVVVVDVTRHFTPTPEPFNCSNTPTSLRHGPAFANQNGTLEWLILSQ